MLSHLLRFARGIVSPTSSIPHQRLPEWSERQCIAYLENHRIPGDIVECGDRKGSRVTASALALLAMDSTQRQLWLYDIDLRDAKHALMQTSYPWEKMLFVPGRVEMTIPRHAPDQIALLRLDTDCYESAYHALEHLYPRLAAGGVLIVDDYGQWVDDYFRNQGIDAELRTIDSTRRLLLKGPRILPSPPAGNARHVQWIGRRGERGRG